jgi:hypothetical protein
MPRQLPPTLRRTLRAARRRGFARLVLGVWLAIHGVVVAGAPAADAMLGHAESVVAHWEDAQDTSCPPLHDPATCQLCQQVSTGFTDDLAGRHASVPVVRRAEILPRELQVGACDSAIRGASDPRGPPVV